MGGFTGCTRRDKMKNAKKTPTRVYYGLMVDGEADASSATSFISRAGSASSEISTDVMVVGQFEFLNQAN